LAGVRRTFIYQLADYGTDGFGAFGLLTADGTEKPAYVELSALMSELNDTAQANPPTDLTLAVTGDFQGVATVLFQKSDGSYRLILWLEKPGWDPRSNMEIAVRDQNVSLTLPPPYRVRRLLKFGATGAATAQSPVPGGASLGLAVGDNLTIVDFARNGS
jgi:hypothetical protein